MTSDWDLAQALIERGVLSLDQAREAISIQERLGKGARPFAELLLERGYASPEQLGAVGAEVKPRPRPAAAPPPRRPAGKPAVALFAAAGALCLVALAIAFGGDVVDALMAGRPADPGGDPGEEAELAEERARADLKSIIALEGSKPGFENAREVVRRYKAYQRGQAGRKGELEAQGRLQAYVARLEAVAGPELEAIREKEPELTAAGRWKDLRALYAAFPAKFHGACESGRMAEEKLAALTKRLIEDYSKARARVDALVKEKDWATALAGIKAMARNAPDGRQKGLETLRRRIERDRRVEGADLLRELGDKYFAIDGEFKKALRNKAPRAAAAAVGSFLFAERPEQERQFLLLPGFDYESLRKSLGAWKPEEVVAACDAAAPDAMSPDALIPGETALLDLRSAGLVALFLRDYRSAYAAAVASREMLDLPGLGRGRFEKRGRETLFVRKNGKAVNAATNPMGPLDRVALAMRAGPEDASRHARAGFYLFYVVEGESLKAFEHLARARRLGMKGIGPYLSTLLPVTRADLGLSLLRKLRAGRTSFENGQWVTARKLLEELARVYPEHVVTREFRSEIEEMLARIERRMTKERRLSDLYRGKIEQVDDKTVRVTYDFGGYDQIGAFEIVRKSGTRTFRGRWRLDRGAMESGYDASVFRWRTPIKGDVRVAYDLTPMESPQNVALDLFYREGASRHYAVVIGFDWIGRTEGDGKNEAEDKFGMPRTCVIKYPVAADKSKWRDEAEWKKWTSRLVGRPRETWRFEKRKATRVEVERRGASIVVRAGGRTVWEGEDGEYTEGGLLFYSDSRCRIDNLSIEFTP